MHKTIALEWVALIVSLLAVFSPATAETQRQLLKLNSTSDLASVRQLVTGGQIYPAFPKSQTQRLQRWLVLENIKPNTLSKLLRFGVLSHDQNMEIALTPNDPLFKQQWALNNTSPVSGALARHIAALQAWELKTTAQEVVVAVVDTGVDYTHEDLAANMWVNPKEANGKPHVDDDNNGCVDDIYGCDLRHNVIKHLGYAPGLGGAYYKSEKYMRPDGMGHGTLVAGVIGAVGNNGKGVTGVSWRTRIMSVKFINQNNAASMLDAAKAIVYAVDNGAHIINASFGKPRTDPASLQALEDAINYAAEKDVLLITAAGNFGVDIDDKHRYYPANFNQRNIVVVAALEPDGKLWDYSNFGSKSVDLAAPGVNILSTAPKGEVSLFRKYWDPSGYLSTEGTSIAAPYVTGVAALIKALQPQLSVEQLVSVLLESVDQRENLKHKTVTGGVLNAYKALHKVRKISGQARPPKGKQAQISSNKVTPQRNSLFRPQ